jgi:hypothetical protein
LGDNTLSDEDLMLGIDYATKPGEIPLLVPETDDMHQMDNFTDRPTVEIYDNC